MDRILVDISPGGQLRYELTIDGVSRVLEHRERPMQWPMDATALDDLRWYLEDYLVAPFGANGDKGQRVADALNRWGEQIFAAIFDKKHKAVGEAYASLQTAGRPWELMIRSSASRVLALPWELIKDPANAVPLALQRVAVTRSVPATRRAVPVPPTAGRLRVLMVISRPAGIRDVKYQLIARPLLECLTAVGNEVEVVVLRPPTASHLRQTLAAANSEGTPFHIVHLDGHGVWLSPGARTDNSGEVEKIAHVILEHREGGAAPVSAVALAQILGEAEVPVVVLNACRSGAMGKDLEAAVATRLLLSGIPSVVAMAYSVYAVAAAEFAAALYERLLAGHTVTEALAAARQRLGSRRERPSVNGTSPLADWMVPVLYRHADVMIPLHVSTRTGTESITEPLNPLKERMANREQGASSVLDSLLPNEPFVGRDDQFYELELAIRRERVIVVHGSAGAGKTELVKAFVKWLRATGGLEQQAWGVWHTLEGGLPNNGLDDALNEVGLGLCGPRYVSLRTEDRIEAISSELNERNVLAVLDNFESVVTWTDGSSLAEQHELLRLIRQLGSMGGRGTVIVISRAPEMWLSTGARRVVVGALTPEEAATYAEHLLAGAPPENVGIEAFTELQRWLAGHPLSMRLILPHLRALSAENVLSELEGLSARGNLDMAHDLLGQDCDERSRSLAASLSYSYNSLDPIFQRLMLVLALFRGAVSTSMLDLLSRPWNAPQIAALAGLPAPQVPTFFAGYERIHWLVVLRAATLAGLVTPRDDDTYLLPPALPVFLSLVWKRAEGQRYQEQRQASESALLRAYAHFGQYVGALAMVRDRATAFDMIDLERPMMYAMFLSALEQKRWAEARCILGPLDYYWTARGYPDDRGQLVERLRTALQAAGGARDSDPFARELWRYAEVGPPLKPLSLLQYSDKLPGEVLSKVAARDVEAGAEDVARLLDSGKAAEDSGDYGGARTLYELALSAAEDLQDSARQADVYEALGMLAYASGQADEAGRWFSKAVDLGPRSPGDAELAHNLYLRGLVAGSAGNLDEADVLYSRALAIHTRIGDRPGELALLNALGRNAESRGQLDQARDWYLRSLILAEGIGSEREVAGNYYFLGRVAGRGGRHDEAEAWFERALALARGYTPGLAASLDALGNLGELQGDFAKALDHTIALLTLFESLQPSSSAWARAARLRDKLGHAAFEAAWREATGRAVPPEVKKLLAQERRLAVLTRVRAVRHRLASAWRILVSAKDD